MKKHIEKQKKAERHCIKRHDHYRAKLVERWIFRMEFWTPDNKIEQVVKASNPQDQDTVISYSYDALGNRVSKHVKVYNIPNQSDEDSYTYYVRDVQGNILSTYSKTGASLVLDEQMLYGSDLLGVWEPENNSQSLPPTSYAYFYNRKIGNKQYSIKDHLGNVRVTFADKKIPANGQLLDFYTETQSVSTYYPFGWEIEPLSWAFDTYKFGFNGQEKSSEISSGNYTAKFWEYDSRIGKRWNIDPKPNTSFSPYLTFANNPVWFSDVLGDSLRTNEEGASNTKLGLEGILNGKENPISYDDKRKLFVYDDKIDISGYTDFQKDVLGRYKAIINSDIDFNLKIIDSEKDEIPEYKLSLKGMNAAGISVRYRYEDEDKTLAKVNIYVARNPMLMKNGKWTYEKKEYAGITNIHEIAGHAFLWLDKPKLGYDEHNIKVEALHKLIFKNFRIKGTIWYKHSTVPLHERKGK